MLAATLAIAVAASVALETGASAQTTEPGRIFWMSPTGSDTTGTGSTTTPWKTFGKAFANMRAGDILALKDGTYTSALAPPSTLSGVEGRPIIVIAEHDGKALINGQGLRQPISLYKNDYWIVWGVVAYNSNKAVIAVSGSDSDRAHHNTFLRTSAYNTSCVASSSDSCNYKIIDIYKADYTTFQDCAAAGRGRAIGSAVTTSYTTLRRCWFRGDRGTGWNNDGTGGFTIYDSNNAVVENNVWADPMPGAEFADEGSHDWNNVYGGPRQRENVSNRYYGNVVGSIPGNPMAISTTQCKLSRDHVWENNVILQRNTNTGAWRRGFAARGGRNLRFSHMTISGNGTGLSSLAEGFWGNASVYSNQDSTCSPQTGKWGYYRDPDGVYRNHSGFDFTMELENSIVQGFRAGISTATNDSTPPVLDNHHNVIGGNAKNYEGLAKPGVGDSTSVMTWDTARFGRGAFFMGAQNAPLGDDGLKAGARVMFMSVNGVPTPTRLWPFPMEDRVWAETGDVRLWEGANSLYTRYQQSPTYWGTTLTGETRTGGWWKTLTGAYP